MTQLKTVFLGTPDFSIPALKLLHNHPMVDLKHVVTMPDRPAGRGKKLHSPAVAEFVKSNEISLLQTSNINKEEKFLNKLVKEGVDLIIVLAFAQFLKERLLKLPKYGCFNIHTSLLPTYRGAAPIQCAILNGDQKTGVTIQRMVKKMDAGDIAMQAEVDIIENETFETLYPKLKNQCTITLDKFIHDLSENKITYIKQDESKVSFAPTLKKCDGFLDFKNETREKILNKVRALIPWPGCWFYIGNKRFKLLEVELEPGELTPATVSLEMGTLSVGCTDGKIIRLTKLQCEGKKVCSDSEIINGFKSRNQCNQIIINPKKG